MKTIFPILPGQTIHLFGTSVANETVFHNNRNYLFFLSRFVRYFHPVCESYGYCLLPNQYNFIVKINEADSLRNFFGADFKSETASRLLANQFGRFILSYTKAINKELNRKGPLFVTTFRRIEINNSLELLSRLRFLHLMPVTSNFVASPIMWDFSSFRSYICDEPSFIMRERVLNNICGLETFKKFHEADNFYSSAA